VTRLLLRHEHCSGIEKKLSQATTLFGDYQRIHRKGEEWESMPDTQLFLAFARQNGMGSDDDKTKE
jgi:hypothetical protein